MIFLIKVVRNALLSSLDNSVHDKDVFTINLSTGIKSSSYFLSIHVGIGSRAQDFVGDDLIIFMISSADTSVYESCTTSSNLLKLSWGLCDVALGAFFQNFPNITYFIVEMNNKFVSKILLRSHVMVKQISALVLGDCHTFYKDLWKFLQFQFWF